MCERMLESIVQQESLADLVNEENFAKLQSAK